MLRVRLVGGPLVEVDGAEVAAPVSKRAWTLLAWLALNPGEHARAEVASTFWPDVMDQSARASLRSAVWAARRALGEAGAVHLTCTRDRIGLTDAWVDVQEAERLVVARRVEDALELAGGELLPGLHDEWALRARDEHRERVTELLERLAEGAADPADAIRWTRRQAAIDPLGEEAHRRLMERLAAAGDRPAALAVYAKLAERLRRELGVAPSETTRRLAQRLRAGDDNGVPAAGPPRALRLVGRGRELRELLAAWKAARGGLGGVVTVRGEPGIGKTRLVQELARHAGGDGARVATGTALDLGGGAPFGIWAELLRELVRDLPSPPHGAAWAGEAARLVPELGPAAPAAAPDVERARLLEAVASLVEWAASDRPAVLVVEDAHVADAASLELAAYVGRRLARLPVLLVMTRRELPRRPQLDALEHELRARGALAGELALGPLERGDVASLAKAVATLGSRDVEAVVSQAEGNALIAVETARARARGDSGPAASLRGAVRAAFRDLSPAGRQVAELAAIAARPMSGAELTDLGVREAGDAASEAVETGLLTAAAAGIGYRHALLREAAYTDLPGPRRAELHERVAAALARGHDRRAGEAARHFRLAGRDDLAVPQLARAASHARSVAALEQAVALLEEALTIAPESPDLLVDLAEAEAWRGRRQPAEDAFARALPLLERSGGLPLAEALIRQARWYHGPVCYPSGVAVVSTRVLDVLDQVPGEHTSRRAEALAALAWAEAVAGDLDRAEHLIEEVAQYSETSLGDALFPYNLGHAQALALIRRGRFEEAYEPSIVGGETADRAGRPDLAYGCWINAAGAAAAAGDDERALGFMDRAAESLRDKGILGVEVQMLAARASILERLGRIDEARACVEAEREMAELAGDPELSALVAHDRGMSALGAGDYDEAEQRLREALEGGATVSRPLTRLARAEALARLGRCEDAEAELRATTLEPVGRADFPDTLVPRLTRVQGLVAAARGDNELAARRLAEAAEGWRRRVAPRPGEGMTAALADFGRPVIGIVDPELELEKVLVDLRALEAAV